MKITKSQLREIIKEEIEREVPKEGDKLELISEADQYEEAAPVITWQQSIVNNTRAILVIRDQVEHLTRKIDGSQKEPSPGDDDSTRILKKPQPPVDKKP